MLAADVSTGPQTALRSALESLNDMETSLNDLLALARDVPEQAPLDLTALLADAERRWQGTFAAAGRPLRLAIDDDLPPAVGSSRAARQVLEVLLANAVAHGRGTVAVRARDAAAGLAVDIENEGSGLPEDLDVFTRRPEAGAHGIGLARARSLVETEGGLLFVSRRAPHPRFTWLVAVAAASPGPTA